MQTHATAQLIGDRSHQCDATATYTAIHVDAEAGLRAVYNQYAAEPDRQDPYNRLPTACAVVAVHTPGKPLTVAWCGDARAYVLTASGTMLRLTEDHNLRRVWPPHGNRNRITSWLGSELTDEQVKSEVGHPAIETAVRHPVRERLLLASDGAYEPLEDSCRNLAHYLTGTPAEAARALTRAAIAHAGEYADNATALIADLNA
jgi:serine/threonine protein phosphatase PrpC